MKRIASKKIDEHHYTGNLTFWQYAKPRYHIERPTKYCVIFNTWRETPESFSCTEFDTIDDAMEEAKLLNEMYCNTPKPVKVYSKNGKHKDGIGWRYDNYDWDFSNGKHFWGYAVLDMINCKFVKIVNGLKNKAYSLSKNPKLQDYDVFFRGENEIPTDYQWDTRGEYDGWLQFRWGDGKNAIGYIEEPKKERPGHDEYVNIWDDSKNTYVRQRVRVVDVPWDAPLPKKEKGIYYRRPNKEPVKFPGDLGYDDDYSMWPWSLSEEIAEEDYIDNGNTLDKKESTSSIADILGENNPLLKLKFD